MLNHFCAVAVGFVERLSEEHASKYRASRLARRRFPRG